MNKEILQIIKKAKGSLLDIGLVDSEILDAIDENDNIYTCFVLSNISLTGKRFNVTGRGKTKKINIKKIRKYFKKKTVDTIICNYNTIYQFRRSFIPSSVYINKGSLYIYGDKEQIEQLKLKYMRYTFDIHLAYYDNKAILKVNNEKTKNYFFKDFIYKVSDFFVDSLDIITELILN